MTRPNVPAIHGPDHLPDGPDPVAFGTVMGVTQFHKLTDQSISHDTQTRIAWAKADGWSSFDSFESAGSASGGHDAGLTTSDYLYTYQAGVWLVGCSVLWETGSYSKYSFLQDEGYDYSGGASEGFFTIGVPPGATAQPWAEGVLSQNPMNTAGPTLHKHWDIWFQEESSLAYEQRFSVRVKQTSGSSKLIVEAKLTVMRLGAYLPSQA